jgi:hypothetical protein
MQILDRLAHDHHLHASNLQASGISIHVGF